MPSRLARDVGVQAAPERQTPALARLLGVFVRNAAHVYRTIARIAKRDPAFSLTLHTDGRLQAMDNGKRVTWYWLKAGGKPYAYGAHEDEKGSLCGPWKYEKRRHPPPGVDLQRGWDLSHGDQRVAGECKAG